VAAHGIAPGIQRESLRRRERRIVHVARAEAVAIGIALFPRRGRVLAASGDVRISELERGDVKSAEGCAEHERDLIDRRHIDRDTTRAVGRCRDDGVGEKGLRTEHALGLRASVLRAYAAFLELQKALHDAWLGGGVLQQHTAHETSQRAGPAERGRALRMDRDAADDLSVARAHGLRRGNCARVLRVQRGCDRQQREARVPRVPKQCRVPFASSGAHRAPM
jgi:hypothetical protein